MFRYLPIVGVIVYGLYQFDFGYHGIQLEFGTGWAITAVIVALLTGFTPPIVYGSYVYATSVLGWHWALALLFAVPSLAFIIPYVLVIFYSWSKK